AQPTFLVQPLAGVEEHVVHAGSQRIVLHDVAAASSFTSSRDPVLHFDVASHGLLHRANASSTSTSCTVFDPLAFALSAAIGPTSGIMLSAMRCTASTVASCETRRKTLRFPSSTAFARRRSPTLTVRPLELRLTQAPLRVRVRRSRVWRGPFRVRSSPLRKP